MTTRKLLKKDWTRVFGFNGDDYDNIYYWTIRCYNCNENNCILVKKGVSVPESIECENCGCQTKRLLVVNQL